MPPHEAVTWLAFDYGGLSEVVVVKRVALAVYRGRSRTIDQQISYHARQASLTFAPDLPTRACLRRPPQQLPVSFVRGGKNCVAYVPPSYSTTGTSYLGKARRRR
jgi:hypothetical protein